MRPADGNHFEDYAPGRRFRHATPRTLGPGEAAIYIALTGARHPLHCSVPLARAMGYRDAPLDDLLVFNTAFGKTVTDVSYNAVANLGYADVRFGVPVFAGDTLACESEVIGTKPNSSGRNGVVYVRSRATNQEGDEVLSWVRWVMAAARAKAEGTAKVPSLPQRVMPARFEVPGTLRATALTAQSSGSDRLWDDFEPGETLDHPGAMTIEESDHMSATRLYQNPARVHFDGSAAAATPSGRRLVYGGHVISVCRALSFDGLENAFRIAAIHGGTHANPTFAGDTLHCRHVVVAREEIPGRGDVGSLRLRMLGVKDQRPERLPALAPGEKNAAVVLELDYSVLIPRRQNP